MAGAGWYYGALAEPSGTTKMYEIFYAKSTPTLESHGHLYAYVEGPYRTKTAVVAATPSPARMAPKHSRRKRNVMTRLLEEHSTKPKLRQRGRRRNPLGLLARQQLAKVRGELYDARKYAELAQREVTHPLSRRHLEDVIKDIARTKSVVDRQTEIIAEIEEGRRRRS